MNVEGLDWITDGISLWDAIVLFILAYVIWEFFLSLISGFVHAISKGWYEGRLDEHKERLHLRQRADEYRHPIGHYDDQRKEG